MDALHRVFEQHSDDETLQNIIKVLQRFSTSPIAAHTERKQTQLIDEISMQFRQATEGALQEMGEQQLDDEDEAQVLVGFRKLNALLMWVDARRVRGRAQNFQRIRHSQRGHLAAGSAGDRQPAALQIGGHCRQKHLAPVSRAHARDLQDGHRS